MKQLSREGHRERMRKIYIENQMENMSDHNLLELFVSCVIPRKDVKQISYDLINQYDNLENVVNAPVSELMKINGIGEVAAVELSLIGTINKRIQINKNKNVRYIKTIEDALVFCKNRLSLEKVEKIMLITLDNNGKLLGDYIISQGTVNESVVSKRDALAAALKDNASNVILSHNHPNSVSTPSAADINMTINLKKTFREVGITLLDHIIVGTDGANPIMNMKIFNDKN